MRKIQLNDNGEFYYLMEGPKDIESERFNVFKQYYIQNWEKVDQPSFLLSYQKAISYFEKGHFYSAMLEFENYKKSVELQEEGYDGWEYCFALICMKEGEEQSNTLEENFLQEKILEFREKGLTRDFLEQSIVNFTKATPIGLGAYLEMLNL